ncbi:hypothetical protein [Saccharomonospora sp.]|uniref:hypothetical protein n=1 Tax=Saccharomonospora sp. TaxID=33913 RepID=UPI002602AA75|nr:hypothetical protein [Saccharomonospora sp.]
MPLTEIADEGLGGLRTSSTDVRVEKREESGTAENPGLTQVVRFSTEVEGRAQELVQVQTYIGMQDTGNPDRRAVLQFVLTVQLEALDQLVGDFQELISSVRPEGG